MENFVCHGGIAYETKNTAQNKLRGKKRGGDGTVPYASLSYCLHWKNEIDVHVEELEGAEHREILKDKTFTRMVSKFIELFILIPFQICTLEKVNADSKRI